MKLVVQREPTVEGVTLGSLFLDGHRAAETLEDPIRDRPGDPVETWKVDGDTAIPSGSYRLVLTLSTRFKTVLPEVLNVPGFVGIRIHAGNTTSDTHGCLLVGTARSGRAISGSKVALEKLMALLRADPGPHSITYINPHA